MGKARSIRRALAASVIGAVLIALTGCSTLNAVPGDIAAAAAASDLQGTLNGLPGVASATVNYTPLSKNGRSVTATVKVRSAATTSQWAKIAEAANAGLTVGAFTAVAGNARFSASDGQTVRLLTSAVDARQVGHEITRWRTLEAAATVPLELQLAPDGLNAARMIRVYRTPEHRDSEAATVLAHWNDIAAVPDPAPFETTWLAPGFQFSGGRPTDFSFKLIEEASKLLPPAPMDGRYTTSGMYAVLVGGTDRQTHLGAYSSSPLGVDSISTQVAAELALIDAGPARSTASWLGSNHVGFMTVGPCANGSTMTAVDDDRLLVAAIRAAGYPIPHVEPGHCT